jgi:hypothetical protein
MLHEMIFKMSIFGDFDNIQPTPETIVALVNEFAEFEAIPSIFTETNNGTISFFPVVICKHLDRSGYMAYLVRKIALEEMQEKIKFIEKINEKRG